MKIRPTPLTIVFTVGIAAAALTACVEKACCAPFPTRTLEVALATPHADDAAIVIGIVGPGIGSLTAAETGHYLHTVGWGTGVTTVLVGDLSSGRLVRFDAPAAEDLDAYSANVIEAADETNTLQTLTGYDLIIREVDGP